MIDGIYFGLSEETYRAIPRLSISGIQNALVSPATFWVGSWLNPKKAALLAASALAVGDGFAAAVVGQLKALHPEMPEPDADAAEESTKAQLLGKAYHTARLEPELLDSRFVRAPDKADYPRANFVGTGKDVEAALASLGLTKKTKDDNGVADQARRLRDAGFEGTIWPLVQAEFQEQLAGRTSIPAELWDDLVDDMELIRSTPEIAALLTNGAAEVSILWTDERGIPMKCRVDYLRDDGWVDFKTFANPMGKHLEQCLSDAFTYNRYHVQASGYRDPVEMIRGRKLSVQGQAGEGSRELIDAIQLRDTEMACHYVFQEKGGIPNLLAKRIHFNELDVVADHQANAFSKTEAHAARVRELHTTPSAWWIKAQREIRKAKRLYLAYSEIYSAGEKWRPFNPVGDFTDLSFRTHWLDEDVGE